MKILVCDDEAEIRNITRILLESAGYEVVEAQSGRMAVELILENRDVDLCIMDIMMPEVSGIEAAAKIREISSVPIIFLTAKWLQSDKEQAYGAGGDDYVVKPFSSRELLMKVEALIRRYTMYGAKEEGEVVRLFGGVVINADKREVIKNGSIVETRDKELEVLIYLAKNRGRVVSASEIYESVWGEIALPSSSNTVTVHILNLRRKLEENPSSPKIIRTVWGKGYQID
ncbi:MAG: response regulator transcription factor [Ruminococcaceae bacterium]|nr:response regulator transcription factor [Oscillospiraceae bacterium]